MHYSWIGQDNGECFCCKFCFYNGACCSTIYLCASCIQVKVRLIWGFFLLVSSSKSLFCLLHAARTQERKSLGEISTNSCSKKVTIRQIFSKRKTQMKSRFRCFEWMKQIPRQSQSFEIQKCTLFTCPRSIYRGRSFHICSTVQTVKREAAKGNNEDEYWSSIHQNWCTRVNIALVWLKFEEKVWVKYPKKVWTTKGNVQHLR